MEYNKNIADKLEEQRLIQAEKRLKEEDVLKQCLKKIVETKEGRIFLKYLNQLCLWSEQDLNINLEYLTYKKGRRDIWVMIRQLMPDETLFEIEIKDNLKIVEE